MVKAEKSKATKHYKNEESAELRMGEHFHARHAHKYVFAYAFVVILGLTLAGIYSWQQHRLRDVDRQIYTQRQIIRSLEAQYPSHYDIR